MLKPETNAAALSGGFYPVASSRDPPKLEWNALGTAAFLSSRRQTLKLVRTGIFVKTISVRGT
jgi:hypothetical protein